MNDDKGKYGVVICPECRSAKIVDLNNKSSKCHSCGQKLGLKKVKIHYQTDSREEASWVIGRYNAKKQGKTLPDELKQEDDEIEDPHLKASKKAEVASDEKERLEIVSQNLCESMGEFDENDIEKVYDLVGREKPEDLKRKLKDIEEIYEPREGVFKFA